jgi:hypothetical protein
MNYKALMRESDVRPFAAADLALSSIPADGNRLLGEAARQLSSYFAAYPRRARFEENVELSSYPYASGSYYDHLRVGFIICTGDLVVDGDLIDDHFEGLPFLIVRGDLSVRNWLRGGMPGFVGGSVRASGFIVGHYDDAALFVGGDLTAAGYVRCAKPYPDFPDVAPHQIAGRIDARQFDTRAASRDELRAAFVDDVLIEEDEDTWLDETAVVHQFNDGLAVWR